MDYDIFISHASEDKDSFVRTLADQLGKIGCKLWYDEFSLRVGDSLSRSIDRGLARSCFGIVVLSPHFLSKRWPEYELRGLITREIAGKSAILPILHGVDIQELADYSPPLADKVSLNTKTMTLEEICSAIIQVVRPDIYSRIVKTLFAERLYADTKEDWFKIIKKLNPRTEIPTELTTSQIVRLRIIRGLLHPYLSHIEPTAWLHLIAHQEDPELEIAWWENLCVFFLEFARYKRVVEDSEKLHLLLQYLFALLWKQPFAEMAAIDAWLSGEDKTVLEELMSGMLMVE